MSGNRECNGSIASLDTALLPQARSNVAYEVSDDSFITYGYKTYN